MIFRSGLTAFFLMLTQMVLSQGYNRPSNPQLFPYVFHTYGSAPDGYFFLSPFKIGVNPSNPAYKTPCLTITNEDGYVVWYTQNGANDFKYFHEDSLMGYIRTKNGIASYQLMDLNMNIVDSFTNVNGIEADAHEFYRLSNGDFIIGGARDSVMDLSAYIFNGSPGSVTTTVVGYVLQQFDPSHNLVFQWNSIDHIHPSETYETTYGYNVNNFDAYHGNAIEEDDDGNLLISFRHMDAVYKIDHTTGNVIWRLGGKSSDFSFPNDSGFGGQHDVRRLDNGDVSVFDNANTAPPPRKSRGVAYTLDTISWTATRSWQYIHSPAFFASAMGNHQTLYGTEHVVNYGLVYRPRPSVVMVDDGGNIICDFYLKDSVMTYRTHFYADIPFNFTQPDIICDNVGTGIMLYAPSGYNKYLWSTGDTTSSIFITTPDTFQLWVDYGVGMLGSHPLIIANMITDCNTAIENTNPIESSFISAWFDLLGREVEYRIPGNLYIALYNNGKKRLYFEY